MVNDEIDEVPSGRNSLGVTVNACDIRRWVMEHENSRQFKIKTHRQRDKKAGMEGDRSRDGRKEGGKGETIQCNTEPKSRSKDTHMYTFDVRHRNADRHLERQWASTDTSSTEGCADMV